jgi:hypothetical protein
MKILKKILIGLSVLIILPLIIALFIKKDYEVERSIIIQQPKTTVFNYIKYLKNQNQYSKWAKMDPNMKTNFTGTDGTPGFISAWEGNDDVGKGEQEIKRITEGKRIETEIRFKKPWEATSPSFMSTDSVAANETKVVWNFKGNMAYPTNLMRVFMNMDKMIGDDLETGLKNLKQILEK